MHLSVKGITTKIIRNFLGLDIEESQNLTNTEWNIEEEEVLFRYKLDIYVRLVPSLFNCSD